MEDLQKRIHDKGFAITDYSKIKVGLKNLEDAILSLGSLKAVEQQDPRVNKGAILQALNRRNAEELRDISNLFWNISGIYERVCNYFAFLYRFDWYVVPEIYKQGGNDKKLQENILKDFSRALNYLDNSQIRKTCGDIALETIINGAYYGYVVDTNSSLSIQQLPIAYCRSRYSVGGNPAVEFNMKFFDDKFKDPGYRLRILKLFPDEFSKGYMLYKQGKLVGDTAAEKNTGWYLLDPNKTVKFNFNSSDIPLFVNAIPAILDLDAAQELDRRK